MVIDAFKVTLGRSVCSCRHAIAAQRSTLLSEQQKRHVLQRRRQTRKSAVSMTLTTSAYELAESGSLLSTLFVGSVSLAIAVNIGISSLPLLTGAAKTSSATDDDNEEEDGVKWGVMSVISCIPSLNWLVWPTSLWDFVLLMSSRSSR